MPDIASIIQSGAGNAWVYLPAALLLGALHALEPGHSKSMMAAFIVAVRGTAAQATLLGVSSAIGHTLVVWVLAIAGLWLGDKLILDKAEPWLVLLAGLMIMAIAVRILYRLEAFGPLRVAEHSHGHDHHHTHGEHEHGHEHGHDHGHGHSHADAHVHNHDHSHARVPAANVIAQHAHLDAHAAAHAADLEKRLIGRPIANSDIAWFGFTAGLVPCPAAFAVLLVCLQLKQMALGIAMVAAFSIGLALTLVAVGIAAAWGARTASARLPWLDQWSHRLPYASAAILFVVGTLITIRGLTTIGAS